MEDEALAEDVLEIVLINEDNEDDEEELDKVVLAGRVLDIVLSDVLDVLLVEEALLD